MTNNAPLVFITGASSGIGQALAERYARAGYRLALLARRAQEMESWAKRLQLDASRYQIYCVDVTNHDALIAAAELCMREQGLPEVVIANAGISIGLDTAQREDIAVMHKLFATNTIALMATFHPFIAPMTERAASQGGRGGTLVGIASVAGIRGLPGHSGYCASKAAAISYCESLRGELRSQGVQVVTIAPGYIDTPLTRKNKYPMPFLMPAADFAERAFRVISAGDSYRVIPWQMGVVAKLLRLLPNAWFDRLLQGKPRKARAND